MYIRVHAVPDARKECVMRESEGVYTIAVKEPAERNMANTRIREILAEELGVSVKEIKLLTGHRSPSKVFVV